MNILFVGDIVGQPGRKALAHCLPELREQYAIDVVIANAENAAGGLGATPEIIKELTALGVHGITMGNHTWAKKELIPAIDSFPHLVRPANFCPSVPGRGYTVIETPEGHRVGIVNLLGRVYMDPVVSCPFTCADQAVKTLRESVTTILVDIHAEATAEKIALLWHLDGYCTAVVGTHTHVETADEQVTGQGTAYISDVGMTGPMDSVIGVDPQRAVNRFITGLPAQYKLASGRICLNAVTIQVDETSGRARSIERVHRVIEP